MLNLVGLEMQAYKYYAPETGSVDFESILRAVRDAPTGSPFILQACCHNPTSADLSKDQWDIIADEIAARKHLAVFDIAYQGLGEGLEDDVYAVRQFAARGLEMLVCQSFSKNFALYGERVGALHVVCSSAAAALNVHDQLRFLIRSEFSSSPAFGARIVETVLTDPAREADWYVWSELVAHYGWLTH
jgi:aspartate aminotransferase